MADLDLKSQRQLQTRLLARLISELSINDVNPGSVVDRLTQAIAQQHFSLYYRIAQVSRLRDLDALTGDDVDLRAFEYGLTRREAQKSSGPISIQRPASFVKVSTTFFAGSPSPIEGDTQIDVNDASSVLIGSSGTLIIGRGTGNEEEVTYSVAPTNFSNYYRFTLDSALVNNHVVEETVILKQGSDEVILAGTILRVPATGTSDEIQFTLDNDQTLLAGEASVDNCNVTAVAAGTDSNISIGAISGTSAFPNPPFSGARATNTAKFTTGTDRESDDELKDRIKAAVQSLSKGVKQAIQNAIVGLVDQVTSKRVVSASIVLPQTETGPVKVYIDDGTGFEPSFSQKGFETVISSSTSGEERLQLDEFPLAKAQIENNKIEPYDMSGGSKTLILEVGNLTETITFDAADFRFPDIATAEEIVAVINDRSSYFEARTSQVGTYVVLTPKKDTNESCRVNGGTANSILGFPTDLKETLNLYIDDVKLSKDGETATLDSGNSSPYNLAAVGAFPHTLTMIVDKKTANVQTATINSSDVLDEAAVTVQEIVAVINRDIAGITALGINDNTKVRLVSNTKLSSNSAIQITGGTLNDASNGLNFSTTQVVGVDGDYTLNKELGIIQLATPLGTNQLVSAGSLYTRAKLRASQPELYSPNTGETLVVSADGGSDQTVTFDGTFAAGRTALETATFINQQLVGATAIVRQIGGFNYVEIRTNTYDISGTIEIKSSSTANGSFGFTLDSEESSISPLKAYAVSGNTGPYDFAELDTLVVILNQDIVNSTYTINMNYPGSITTGTSDTVFSDSNLSNVFESDDELNDFYVAFLDGDNSDTGVVDEVSDQGSNVARYSFSTVPTNFADFAVGDLFKIQSLVNSGNNGYFVITGKGADWVEVTNSNVVNATTQSGDATLSQRRQITDYVAATGTITAGASFRATPSIGDSLIVIPSTVNNLVNYIRNTKVTSFTLKGSVEGVEGNTKLQLSSNNEGSDGYVQVSGGNANKELAFDTDVVRGIQAYSYWTGLIDLVHKTIYGDDTDLVSYPGVGAAGIKFIILAPTVTDVSVEMDVDLEEGVSISSLENEIKSAVSGYINSLGVGDDVIIERIRSVVIQISGIVDVRLSLPADNIAIADNELARIKDSNILIG